MWKFIRSFFPNASADGDRLAQLIAKNADLAIKAEVIRAERKLIRAEIDQLIALRDAPKE